MIKENVALRKKHLLAEKRRLTNLLYYYRKDVDSDLIIKRMLVYIDSELKVIEEIKK